MEPDVRYTGDSWGSFFSSLLTIGEESLNSPKSKFGKSGTDQRPDLVMFAPWQKAPADIISGYNFSYLSEKYPTVVPTHSAIYGMSRKLQSALVKHTRRNTAGYIEQIVPTVAVHENLNTVVIGSGTWGSVDPLNSEDSNFASTLYKAWSESKRCIASIQLHPVRENFELQEAVNVRAFAPAPVIESLPVLSSESHRLSSVPSPSLRSRVL